MSFSIYNGTKILSTKQERQTTILGWLNIFWSKYETHAYKENMLYRHALKEMLLAYLSNINDATFPTLDLSRDRERNDLQFEELYYYISFTLSTLSIYHLIYTKSSSWRTLLLCLLHRYEQPNYHTSLVETPTEAQLSSYLLPEPYF